MTNKLSDKDKKDWQNFLNSSDHIYSKDKEDIQKSDIYEKKSLRLDIYLYYIRIFKSRSLATKFILTNRLRISGQVTQKTHKMNSIGDVLTMTINDKIKIFLS